MPTPPRRSRDSIPDRHPDFRLPHMRRFVPQTQDVGFRSHGQAQGLCYFVSHMATASTSAVLASTRQWLKPLVHVLIRCGITWREFADVAKIAYVEVATRQFGKRGRPTNVSRTAVLTGLARRDVRAHR